MRPHNQSPQSKTQCLPNEMSAPTTGSPTATKSKEFVPLLSAAVNTKLMLGVVLDMIVHDALHNVLCTRVITPNAMPVLYCFADAILEYTMSKHPFALSFVLLATVGCKPPPDAPADLENLSSTSLHTWAMKIQRNLRLVLPT